VRLRGFFFAAVVAVLAVAASSRPTALGRPGITPIPCPDQAWEFGDATFEALPGAKAFFGKYDGGLYRIEIPDTWNGELALYAHGFVSNAGANGSRRGPDASATSAATDSTNDSPPRDRLSA